MYLKTLCKTVIFLIVFLAHPAIGPADIFAQKNCTKAGQPQKFTLHNATTQNVRIKVVGSDCKEDSGKLLKAGDKADGRSYTGVVFRVYGLATKSFIAEITLEAGKEIYKIEEPDTEIPDDQKIDPAAGFLIATNSIRSNSSLPDLQLDERLNNACQWFADKMAIADLGYPVHRFSELGNKRLHKERDRAVQRLVFYGWNKKNRTHFEVVALDTVHNYNQIGENFAKLWAFSTTHSPPFFERVKYNRVGFGAAKAERGRNRYYACAIFARV